MGGIKTDEPKLRITTTIPENVVNILTQMQKDAGLTSFAQIVNICLDSFISYYNKNNLTPDFIKTLSTLHTMAHRQNKLLESKLDYSKLLSNIQDSVEEPKVTESTELFQSFKVNEMIGKEIIIKVTTDGEIIITTNPESES